MRDPVEQGGTSTHSSSGVPGGAVFGWYPVWSRMNDAPPVEASWVEEVVKWLCQPVVGHFVSVEVELVEEDLVELSSHRIGGLPV
jgi:hypothetical protein